jgi:hypothetical protein
MTQDRQKQRNLLIRNALADARQRVAQSTKPDDVFAPIGELVFWIIAADEGLNKQYRQSYTRWRDKHQHGYLFPAIRYARNKVAHESEAWDYRVSGGGYTSGYTNGYGTWVWVQLPRPGKAPNKKVEQSWQQQFAAYNQYLRDKSVVDTTMDAVDLLEDWWKQHGI